ncbi:MULTISPECIES: sensor histidine kinase [unclassified Rathayibacter]|uniref:sensor histidine kinase n=1 Tax=unclassified Rathayibacter TaxID=2609250 RepID=UPI000CE72342|nr:MULTISPECIES: sensor histidine kinase [unclassified Rathayibacter]PPG51739.1 two-component sensor histidine kinase [Rathayibacter sp. AY2B3]PPI27368.1 two-component sensor histidine kinase [Rathayibacter sp. AY1B5]
MPHTALAPVMTGLRAGLHALVGGLLVLVAVRASLEPGPRTPAVLLLCAALLAAYLAGPRLTRGSRSRGVAWLVGVTIVWAGLVLLEADAAYLAFPLFFLAMHVLPPRSAVAAVLALTAVAVVALGWRAGWSVGGVVGPLIAAAVAILIGLAARALAREAREREALLAELLATRDRLGASERATAVAQERARLAREIHDTVAQGLSSIQMLLHAAERADPGRPGIEHVRLARETAAADLDETRRFIRELAPPALEHESIDGALRRLAGTHWERSGVAVTVDADDGRALPMQTQTALLRLAQGAVANALQHSGGSAVEVVLRSDGSTARLRITDDGTGFDPDSVASGDRPDSFGLRAMRERAEQLGGRLQVDSDATGTRVSVELPALEAS